MKCFYHNTDLDGKCSAAIVKRDFPKCELVGINYGDPFPWDTVSRDEIVYMVDFCLQPWANMLRLIELADLTWIDHHKTAIEAWQDAGAPPVSGHRLVGVGACSLVWQHLFDEPLPEGVRLLAEYDVWNHEDPSCLPFQHGMRACANDPGAPIWESVLGGRDTDNIVNTGIDILRYENNQNAMRAQALCFETELDGLLCIAANQGLTNSKLFDSVWDQKQYDAMICFVWRKCQWTVSLYTDKPGVDVGFVAKARGGGGHVGAAGFQCKELPFSLEGRNVT